MGSPAHRKLRNEPWAPRARRGSIKLMHQLPSFVVAVTIAVVLSALVFRFARRYISVARLLTFVAAAALGWLILLRATGLPAMWWKDAVQRLVAATVGVCWFVLIRDAARAQRAKAEVEDRTYR